MGRLVLVVASVGVTTMIQVMTKLFPAQCVIGHRTRYLIIPITRPHSAAVSAAVVPWRSNSRPRSAANVPCLRPTAHAVTIHTNQGEVACGCGLFSGCRFGSSRAVDRVAAATARSESG